MINSMEIENFGPINKIHIKPLKNINLIIGKNSCGKTFLLKILYSAIRAFEEYKRGNNPTKIDDILKYKLYWTFQIDALKDLISNESTENLSFKVSIDDNNISYFFGKKAIKNLSDVKLTKDKNREANSIFIPAKEVLSILDIIIQSREVDQEFGFDECYFELAKALSIRKTKGKNFKEFSEAKSALEGIIEGKIEYDVKSKKWLYKKGNINFSVNLTAEGVKKIAILDTLLSNRYISPESVIFIDEPESGLHPEALVQFLDIIKILSDKGIQFFLATHSYFVIKKLYLIAKKHNISVPVISFNNDMIMTHDLLDDMPKNPIIDESIKLYEEEVELAFNA